MNINLSLTPLLALLAGILILIMPRLLNFATGRVKRDADRVPGPDKR